MFLEYVRYSLGNLTHRKLRSGLMVFSILIGIASVYTLVSFGQGVSSYVDKVGSELGKDKLLIQAKGVGAPGTDASFSISKTDVDFLQSLSGMQEVVGIYMKTVQVKFRRQVKEVFSMSMSGEGDTGRRTKEIALIKEVSSLTLAEGRELKAGDMYKVTLGSNFASEKKLFDRAVRVGDKVELNGLEFEVVGLYETRGNPQDDNNVYMTKEATERLFPDIKDNFQFVMARVASDVDPTEMAAKAMVKFRHHKGQKEGEETFYIKTFAQTIEQFNTILTVINAVLVLIAFISLIVAGVNITNTTYTAVLERTKEIGVMKAVGAQKKDILAIFLLEAGFLGFVGGLFGVLTGYGLASLGGAIAKSAGYGLLTPVFPWQLTLGCLVFSFLIGSLAGLVPSIQAANLKPVDALRYE